MKGDFQPQRSQRPQRRQRSQSSESFASLSGLCDLCGSTLPPTALPRRSDRDNVCHASDSKERFQMADVSVAQALAGQPGENQEVTIKGWVRTRRDSKGGFSFLTVNDGSCFDSIQIV